eukprot:2494915-Amphidinium_carterae.1
MLTRRCAFCGILTSKPHSHAVASLGGFQCDNCTDKKNNSDKNRRAKRERTHVQEEMLGAIPDVLKSLTSVEQQLIAKVQ